MANSTILDAMLSIRLRFDEAARRRKKRLLRQAGRRPPNDTGELKSYYDHLLFMAAYPDDAETLQLVESELGRISTPEPVKTNRDRKWFKSLADTGIGGSRTTSQFTIRIARWLSARCGADVELDWMDDDAISRLEEFLPRITATVERDGLRNDAYDTRGWIALAKGNSIETDLAWLLRRFDRIAVSDALREDMFNRLGFKLRWTHADYEFSRCGTRFPARPPFFQTDDLIRHASVRDILANSVPEAEPLPRPEATRLLDAARAALCVRHRETDPLTYANDREVTLLRLDRGVDVALFGMTPDERLPIESYFGYVAARNRVPMAYGGGWVLGDRCEIGVNIFDEFRGGESAHLFTTILRAYRHHYRVRRFLVSPYQFGAGNPEAIASGAYWFYYRLGFRSVKPAARALAEVEAAKIVKDRRYRTPPATLRRFAKSGIYMDVDSTAHSADDAVAGDFDLAKLGVAITEWIGRRFEGDAEKAQAWSMRRARKLLSISGEPRWSADEQRSFEAFSLLIGPIESLERWPVSDRRALGALMRAKGGLRERDFALLAQKHPRFLTALANLAARQGDSE